MIRLISLALVCDCVWWCRSSYTEFSAKHGKDSRLKGIEKARDRETYFNEYIAELRKRDKEEKERKKEAVSYIHYSATTSPPHTLTITRLRDITVIHFQKYSQCEHHTPCLIITLFLQFGILQINSEYVFFNGGILYFA